MHMVEQNYTALHGIVVLLLRPALHSDKIRRGESEPRSHSAGKWRQEAEVCP